MVDLHTHILPGMDDGAQTIEESLAMLCEQARQGVQAVALTPHFYSRQESVSEFLERRNAAWTQLLRATQEKHLPSLILGAEVAWSSQMSQWDNLEELCYQGTKMLLVELPVAPWTNSMFQELYSLENRRGIMPMIAHLDRYYHCQNPKDIDRLLEMGYPIQVSADALSSFFMRKKALELLDLYEGILISDCHNMSDRKPNLGTALKIAEKKRGQALARRIAAVTEEILDD